MASGAHNPHGPWTECETIGQLFKFRYWRGINTAGMKFLVDLSRTSLAAFPPHTYIKPLPRQHVNFGLHYGLSRDSIKSKMKGIIHGL